jgi:hypothetical protein
MKNGKFSDPGQKRMEYLKEHRTKKESWQERKRR